MKKVAILLALMMLVIPVGCKSSVEEAEANFCNDLAELEQALAAVQNLHKNSTVDEAKRAQEAVTDALDNLRKSGAELAAARLDSADAAYDQLRKAISDISGEATLAEAAKVVVDSAKDFEDAIDELYSLNCP